MADSRNGCSKRLLITPECDSTCFLVLGTEKRCREIIVLKACFEKVYDVLNRFC